MLNTGHIGYSPEQYYFTMREYHDKFKPDFVLLSVCRNDFGDAADVLEGGGDWKEAAYWLGEIEQFCRTREIISVIVPVPFEDQLRGRRYAGYYPGRVSDLSTETSQNYIDPIEAFVDENERLYSERIRIGKRPLSSPLFNGHIHDGHFSPAGCELWASVVARRLAVVVKPKAQRKAGSPTR